MLPTTPLTTTIGMLLARVVVPLWITLGVIFKLWAGSPSTLPLTLRNMATSVDIELGLLLYFLIGLEIFAVAVMVLLPRLSRPMAGFMLASFCAILIGELIARADSCGCFGGLVKIEPWQMLIADGTLLLGVILFPMRKIEEDVSVGRIAAVGSGALLVGMALSFTVRGTLHQDRAQEPITTNDSGADSINQTEQTNGDIIAQSDDPTINPTPLPLPPYWYPQDLPSWIGKPWREVELFQFMPRWPEGLDEGKTYVVVYSRTCDHCEEMFHQDLIYPLDAPVVAIEIPASKTEVTAENAWPMPNVPDSTQFLHLPLGTDWSMITAPTALRIEDGIVTFAEEGEHRHALGIFPTD